MNVNIFVKDDKYDYINPKIVMISKRHSGLSWINRNILFEMRNIPYGVVIVPTNEIDQF